MTRAELHDLLVDRATIGLDVPEADRLDQLLAIHPDEDVDQYERLSADLDLALWGRSEPLPESLARRLESAAEAFVAGARVDARAASRTARLVQPASTRAQTSAAPARSDEPVPAAELPLASWRWLAAAAILLAVAGWWPRSGAPTDWGAVHADILSQGDVLELPWQVLDDPTSTAASGDVVWSPALQRGVMRFAGLAANDPQDFQYQLWIFDAERDEAHPVDGGVFDVTEDGEVFVGIDAKLDVAQATAFAITVERPGGVVVSSRERLALLASLP